MSKIYTEENQVYEIDLSRADKAVGDLHEKYSLIGNFLSDVDFIAEDNEYINLIEYKNTDIPNAVPAKFLDKISSGQIYNWIQRKFYGSLVYVLSTSHNKKINFYFILECKNADSVVLRRLRNSAKKRLPFRLQELPEIHRNLINEFDVLSINEWNQKFPDYPVTRI